MQQPISDQTTYCEPCDRTLKTHLGYLSHIRTARVHRDERIPTAREEQPSLGVEGKEVTEAIAELRQIVSALKAPQHLPGLCESSSCQGCRRSEIKIAIKAIAGLEKELRAATDFSELDGMVDALIAAHKKWISEGRPNPVKPDPIEYLMIDGLKITA